MIERFCRRSFWYDAHLRDEVMRLDLKALEICDGMHPKEVVDECLRLLARGRRSIIDSHELHE
jgi:hypothetical protein